MENVRRSGLLSLVIGLTGGIASGKSTVARMLIDKK
ncbi:dephospho-CoA kinase [Bacillus velezensis]|nr:dephospho-CoA kinase [Bacillus velezensis]